MNESGDILIGTLHNFWGEMALFAPKALAATVLLIAGWLVARLLRVAVRKMLGWLHFGRAVERSGLEALGRENGIELSIESLVGGLVYWFAILIVVLSVANSLGLHIVVELLNRVVLYLPNFLVAILILVFGTLLARLVNRIVFAWLQGAKVEGALTISTLSEYAIQVFALFLALEQLAIGTQLLLAAFVIAFGGLSLALALAFGLGGREWAAAKLQAWENRQRR